MDWHQLWEIVSTPDNVPIVALVPLLIIFTYMAIKQARANDELIAELETNPALAKTHHRKTWPFRPGWQKEVHVWPFLLRIEFLAAIIVTAILMVWSITLNAPMEEPSNPNVTMNPAKAPWYFLGLQEMLVYFDPWMAGVVMPSLIIVGLMVGAIFGMLTAVGAEMVGGKNGLGNQLMFWSSMVKMTNFYAIILLLALMGVSIYVIFYWIGKKWAGWQA